LEKTMRAEDQLQIAIVDYLTYVIQGPKLIHSIPNEAKRSAARGGIMKRMGLVAGVADLVLIYDGRAHYIEVKTDKGVLRPAQSNFAIAAHSAGAAYSVVRSINDVERCLAIWDIPTREVKNGRAA
jgi:hypothetical protein